MKSKSAPAVLSATTPLPLHTLSHSMLCTQGVTLAWSRPMLSCAWAYWLTSPLASGRRATCSGSHQGGERSQKPRQTGPAARSIALSWDGFSAGWEVGGWRSQLVGGCSTILEGQDWRGGANRGLITELSSLRKLGAFVGGCHTSPQITAYLRGHLTSVLILLINA